MSKGYLLDTNALSEPLKPKPNPGFLKRLANHADALFTAAPVVHEMWYGAERLPSGKRRRAIEQYLRNVLLPSIPVLPYDGQAALIHAVERARLTGRGKTPAFVDGQIAAIALVHGLIVITANIEDFVLFEGLTVMSWLA